MSTALLVQAMAVLSVPALAGASLLGVRLRCGDSGASLREAGLRGRITELEERCAELERTASCDPLTGAWNYRHLQLTLGREIERARRADQRADRQDQPHPLALLMLEISGFDAIITEQGRGRGNAILRDLVQRLGMEIRRSDTLGRYGGQEFLVLLPDTGVEGAVQVAERLIWSVRRHRLLEWSTGPREPRPAPGNGLTAAVGIAVLPRDGAHAALLLRAADRALTEAKQAGGDCWRGASPPRPAVAPPRHGSPPGAPGRPAAAAPVVDAPAPEAPAPDAATAAAPAADAEVQGPPAGEAPREDGGHPRPEAVHDRPRDPGSLSPSNGEGTLTPAVEPAPPSTVAAGRDGCS
ncbi:GGDEF domain-containing protein [Kitasatospora sp. NPDC057015]|uniref:GGDEF domain-containing protein n=1 Tax=Kitasatospora sp. NPDC057015 TaxID=3346001 RepID=UPI003631A98D